MKTAINTGICSDLASPIEVLPHIADAGFDGCFWGPYQDLTVSQMVRHSADHNLDVQSFHAPFGEVHRMWEPGEAGDQFLDELIGWARQCADCNVPIMVSHVWIGFVEPHPNQIGIDRFGILLREAEKLGVKIAFENTEGEAYLEAIKANLWDSPAAGFCIDTGHEMCYNYSRDMIAKYGDKLIATHLNDNLGITTETIFWLDDAHLFPFDGIADWQGIADRLKKIGYRDYLTFELTNRSKPGRNTHDRYKGLTPAQMLKLAHSKAAQFAALMD